MEAFARRHRRTGAEGWTMVFWQELLRRLPADDGKGDDWDEAAAAALDWADALRALPLPMRQVFLLRVWVGFDIGQCARVTGSTDSAAKSRLYHALQRMSVSFGGGAGPAEGWLMRCRALLDEYAAQRTPALLGASEPGFRAALDAARPARFLPWERLVVLAIVIAVAATVVALLLRPQEDGADGAGGTILEQPMRISAEPIEQVLSLPAEDFALLVDPAEFELLAELEFYRWLEQGMPNAP
jgi:hypothetical protein